MFLLTRPDGTPITTRERSGPYCDEVKVMFFENMQQAIDYATSRRINATVGKVTAVAQVTHETIHRVTVDPLLGEP